MGLLKFKHADDPVAVPLAAIQQGECFQLDDYNGLYMRLDCGFVRLMTSEFVENLRVERVFPIEAELRWRRL